MTIATHRRPRLPRFARTAEGGIGLLLTIAIVIAIVAGPFVTPHDPTQTLSIPASAPSGAYPLGTDFLGRDVLSRLLDGGATVLLFAGAATLLCYAIGVAAGLIAGYSRSVADPIIMRVVDFILAFPALLLLLLLVTGLGTSMWVTVLGVALVLFPGAARIVRTATMEVSVRGYVEAAVARGERMPAILRQEILPNITSPIMADVGIRFAGAIIFIASVNYLGLGLRPPASDWGLMVSENRQAIYSNPLAVLAPAIMIGLLTIAVNLVADSYARTRGTHGRSHA